MNITIRIDSQGIVIDDLRSLIGQTANTTIAGDSERIAIAGQIIQIADDDIIIDSASICDISQDEDIINGSIARDGSAPRGSLIPAQGR